MHEFVTVSVHQSVNFFRTNLVLNSGPPYRLAVPTPLAS